MNKRFLIFTLLGSLGAAGLLALACHAREETTVTQTTLPVQEVATERLQPQRIVRRHSLPGRVVASRQSEVRPQVDGIVTRRLFEEGTEVEKGQQLYQIDDTRYKAELSSAIADLHSAQANLEAAQARAKRYGELVQKNAISRQDHDDAVASLGQAQAAVGVAQAKVDLAQIDVDYTKVYAPISGHISRSKVSEGALVTANQTLELATITALDPVYVDMQQSAGDQAVTDSRADLARENSVPVQLVLERGGVERTSAYSGRLKFSEVTMDETTGATTLRAEIPNPEGDLLPGMFVRAVLELGEEEALLVPQRATTRTAQGDLTVWVVDSENKARQRTIQVDSAYEDEWIVSGGLEAGDTLITVGYQKVQDGQLVSTVAWNAPQATELALAGSE
jgi:membrane fusion protein (multidrug efflux system)